MNEFFPALTDSEMLHAWQQRDASYDGVFCFGVRTTGIFCRPSCPSQPKPENMQFFRTAGEAVRAGYRPCKRCQPELAGGEPPDWVRQLMERAEASLDQRLSADDLRAMGIAPERARRWFQQHHGMTFAAWCRGLRLSRAFTQIRNGEPMDDVILGHGFDSHSGFREAFSRTFGKAPGQSRHSDCLRVAMIDTPIGPMLTAVSNDAVCQLEFADRRGLEKSYAAMRERFALPVVPGDNEVMEKLRSELAAYFAGRLRDFTVPADLRGSEFQTKAWRELQRIPYGRTASYEQIAQQMHLPKAVRAVARANATNRLYLLVPCHRVIGKDGSLSGYGGGVWRKQWLLNLESA